VAKGTQPTAWRAVVLRGVAPGCVDAGSAKNDVLGGEPALPWSTTCSGVHPVKMSLVHGTRGYVAIVEPRGSSMDTADSRVFDSVRRSFRFTGQRTAALLEEQCEGERHGRHPGGEGAALDLSSRRCG
jgi:hypothetical protein